MESKKLRIKVSESQKEMIVTYMENHPDLNKGGLTYTFTKKMRQNLWQELTDQLNSKGTCIKTMDKWIKCWSDLKQEVKKRFSEREQYKNGTGKRPSSKDLSELDLRVLALIGTDGYAGLKVKETAPRIVLQLSYNASPAASNPQDASPAASIPYDASPAASTSYDNAFVAPVIKVEKVQGGEDSTCQEGSFISETSQVGKEAFIPQQAVREVLQLSYNASPAASNPQDASPAASIPYDASPAASTSYDNAFVAPVIKVEKVQGGEDSTCQEGSFISETSQVGKEAFIPQQAVREVLRPSHNDSPAASTPRDASPAASNPQDASPAASNPQDASPAASNPQDASPAASNPQDASPAASIPYDASPSASTSYDNAFVAPAIKIEKVQGGQDSTCQEGSFISETSQVGIEAFIPQQAVREVRRGVKRKRARNILIPTEKAEKIIESQEKTFEALKDIASNLSAANEIARRANEIAEERNNISLRKAIAFENISKILSNVFGNNK